MKKHKHLMYSLLAAALGLLLLSGCGQETAEENQKEPLVQVIQVGKSEAASTAGTYSGTVKGRYESNLSFQAGGRITARNVQLGTHVNAGSVLMTVDPKDVNQSVSQAQAALDSAASQLALAKADLSRYQQLYVQDAISAASLDQYQTAYNQAAARYDQAQAALTAQQNQLGYTQLTADAAGVISALNGEVGQVVSAGQTVVTLVHDGDLEVQVNVPENKIAAFPVGKTVTVSFWALQNQDVSGQVREVAPMADSASRTYKVCVYLPNPPDGMQLGMTATVHNPEEEAEAADTVILPLSAIYQTGNTPQVWLVGSDQTLSLKAVQVEEFGNNTVKVTGLKKGDQVVTAGVHLLSSGEKVRTEEAGST